MTQQTKCQHRVHNRPFSTYIDLVSLLALLYYIISSASGQRSGPGLGQVSWHTFRKWDTGTHPANARLLSQSVYHCPRKLKKFLKISSQFLRSLLNFFLEIYMIFSKSDSILFYSTMVYNSFTSDEWQAVCQITPNKLMLGRLNQ